MQCYIYLVHGGGEGVRCVLAYGKQKQKMVATFMRDDWHDSYAYDDAHRASKGTEAKKIAVLIRSAEGHFPFQRALLTTGFD